MCNDTLLSHQTNNNAPKCGNTAEASNHNIIRGNDMAIDNSNMNNYFDTAQR